MAVPDAPPTPSSPLTFVPPEGSVGLTGAVSPAEVIFSPTPPVPPSLPIASGGDHDE